MPPHGCCILPSSRWGSGLALDSGGTYRRLWKGILEVGKGVLLGGGWNVGHIGDRDGGTGLFHSLIPILGLSVSQPAGTDSSSRSEQAGVLRMARDGVW